MSENPQLSDTGARLYAAVHRGTQGDREFYRRLAGAKARVLELGSGFGRISVEMAKAGASVVGIDREPAFLKLAQAAAEEADVADQTQFWQLDFKDLGQLEDGSFDLVTLPHTTLYCVLTKEEQLALLQQANRVLQKGGLLAFDAYFADAFHQDSEPSDLPDDEEHPVVEITDQGRVLAITEKSSWDKAARRIDSTFVYRDSSGSKVYSHTIPQRYVLSGEADELLQAAGFHEVNLASDYSGTLIPSGPEVGAEELGELTLLVALAEK